MAVTFDELGRRIQAATGVDAAGLYEVYRAEGGADDPRRFLAFLAEQAILSPSLHAELAASLGDVPPATAAAAPPYERIGLLGSGAMGEVFEARDRALRRTVALKALKGRATPWQLERFVKEIQVTAQLDHPGVVPVYGLTRERDGDVAYAMKLVRGKELAALLEAARSALVAGRPVDPEHRRERLVDHLRRVCEAVAFAHERGVVHRDIKPANIMIGRFGEAYLMDWGIARVRASAGSDVDPGSSRLEATRSGAILGTPLYMSPEQAAGRNDEVDGRSDLFALGLVLQEILTLRPPRDGASIDDLLARARRGERAPLAPHPGDAPIPREARAIVALATHPEPAARYPDVSAFAEDLRRLLAGEEVRAAPDDLLRRAARGLARHRGTALGVLVVLTVATVAAVVTLTAVVNEKRAIEAAHAHDRAMEQLVAKASSDADRLDEDLQRLELVVERLAGATAALARSSAPSAPSTASPAAPPVPPAVPAAPDGSGITSALESSVARALAEGRAAPAARSVALSPRRVYAKLASGVVVSLPHDTAADGVDAARYAAATAVDEPVWSRHDGGARLACSTAVRGDGGEVLGVVGLDLPLEDVRVLLARDGAPWAEARFADREGETWLGGDRAAPTPLDPGVAEAVRAGRLGLLEVEHATFVIVPVEASHGVFVARLREGGADP